MKYTCRASLGKSRQTFRELGEMTIFKSNINELVRFA